MKKNQSNVIANVGDIVIIKALGPRSTWKLGRVEKLFEGRDGVVRAAQVVQGNRQSLRRSLQDLFPLEVQDELVEYDTVNNANKNVDVNIERTRPIRDAARKAIQNIRSTDDILEAEDVQNTPLT